MRKASRRDNNEKEIIQALEAVGCSVVPLSAEGVPDLLVGRMGRTYLMEIKQDKGKLTDDQIKFHARWKGQLAVVRTKEEALGVIGITISGHYDCNEHMNADQYKEYLLRERAGMK